MLLLVPRFRCLSLCQTMELVRMRIVTLPRYKLWYKGVDSSWLASPGLLWYGIVISSCIRGQGFWRSGYYMTLPKQRLFLRGSRRSSFLVCHADSYAVLYNEANNRSNALERRLSASYDTQSSIRCLEMYNSPRGAQFGGDVLQETWMWSTNQKLLISHLGLLLTIAETTRQGSG